MNDNPNPHDPIERQLDGEDRFPLMGRDLLSPGLIRLYAAGLEDASDEKLLGIFHAWVRKVRSRPKRPHKDKQHAWSARALADKMEFWFAQNMRGDDPINRVNDKLFNDEPDAFKSMPTHAQIKAARPPLEPDEAT